MTNPDTSTPDDLRRPIGRSEVLGPFVIMADGPAKFEVHEFVWGRAGGWPWWPCQVVEVNNQNGEYTVVCLPVKNNHGAVLKEQQVHAWEKHKPVKKLKDTQSRVYSEKDNEDYQEAVQEVLENSFTAANNDTPCAVCGSNEDPEDALICEGECGNTFHLKCLQPQLSAVPEGDWFCEECRLRRNAESYFAPPVSGEDNSPAPNNEEAAPNNEEGVQFVGERTREERDAEKKKRAFDVDDTNCSARKKAKKKAEEELEGRVATARFQGPHNAHRPVCTQHSMPLTAEHCVCHSIRTARWDCTISIRPMCWTSTWRRFRSSAVRI